MDIVEFASQANYFDCGNILARYILHNNIIQKMEQKGYETIAINKMKDAVMFPHMPSNQEHMKKVLQSI